MTENKSEVQRKNISLRLPRELHRRASHVLAETGTKFQPLIETLLEDFVHRFEEEGGLPSGEASDPLRHVSVRERRILQRVLALLRDHPRRGEALVEVLDALRKT